MDSRFLEEFINKICADSAGYEGFHELLRQGEHTITHHLSNQSAEVNDSWVNTIYEGLFAIEKIVRSPRRFIKDEEHIVAVERAKKTTSKTIRNLSTHTQYIQSYDEDGDVMPKKVLTIEANEDLAIYENRFVYSLMQRLISFVELKYRSLENKLAVVNTHTVAMKSKFNVGQSEIEYNIDMKISEPTGDREKYNKNLALFERVVELRKRLRVIDSSEFMRILAKAKTVKPPIMKTNLLTKNIDYSACYKLWLFISSYTDVGFSIDVSDKNLPVDGDYFDDLTIVASLSLQTLIANKIVNGGLYKDVPYERAERTTYEYDTEYKFVPSLLSDVQIRAEDVINEYYFTKMKEQLIETSMGGEIDKKELTVNFLSFFRAISKINREMYKSIINEQLPELPDCQLSQVQKRQHAVDSQNIKLQYLTQLAKLQKEEYENTLERVKTAQNKLKKLNAELEVSKQKELERQMREAERAYREEKRLERERAKALKEGELEDSEESDE